MAGRKIWAVTSGEYSGYMIHELFTSEELATQHAKGLGQRRAILAL